MESSSDVAGHRSSILPSGLAIGSGDVDISYNHDLHTPLYRQSISVVSVVPLLYKFSAKIIQDRSDSRFARDSLKTMTKTRSPAKPMYRVSLLEMRIRTWSLGLLLKTLSMRMRSMRRNGLTRIVLDFIESFGIDLDFH